MSHQASFFFQKVAHSLRYLILILLFFISPNTIALTLQNGIPFNTSMNSMAYDNIEFVVPEGTSNFVVTISEGSGDLDLYLKYGSPVTGSSISQLDADADHISDGPTANELIYITPYSSPALKAGRWYVATINYNEKTTYFTLTATLNKDLLTTSVQGRDVILDWSAMPKTPEAQSYTLLAALINSNGEIDINSIVSFDMGILTDIYLPNLPSGFSATTAVVAHTKTTPGYVVSNFSQFVITDDGNSSNPDEPEHDSKKSDSITIPGNENWYEITFNFLDGKQHVCYQVVSDPDSLNGNLVILTFPDSHPSNVRINSAMILSGSGVKSDTKSNISSSPEKDYNQFTDLLNADYFTLYTDGGNDDFYWVKVRSNEGNYSRTIIQVQGGGSCP